ncbi:MAG: nucleotide disphospho-sugar-binding domain-containing protein [Lysobacteraceae bacterium]
MTRPRIELLAPPFAGHLHPVLAIGRALRDIADINVVSTERAQDRIRAAGLNGIAVVPGADAALREIVDPPHAIGAHPLRLHAQFRRSLDLLDAFASVLDARYAHSQPDLLIADFTLPVAGPVAKRHRIPWWTSHPSPCVIEAAGGPPAYLGGWMPGAGVPGKLRDDIAARVVRGFKTSVHHLHRRRLAALGFPSLYRGDGSEAAYSDECILGLGLRELEFERAWPSALRFIGPLLWSPPGVGAALPSTDGGTHILATLGTHLGFAKNDLAAQLDSVAHAYPDIRLHFSDGRLDGGADETHHALQRHAWVDYPSWVPQMRAVLHHGGAGVMWECLRAGVPALVLPNDYDQFDHAARLQAAGVAVRLHHPREIGPALRRLLDGEHDLHADRFIDALRPGIAEAQLVRLVKTRLGV